MRFDQISLRPNQIRRVSANPTSTKDQLLFKEARLTQTNSSYWSAIGLDLGDHKWLG